MDVIWLFVVLLFSLISIQFMKIRHISASLPPGPTPLPFIGNLFTTKFQLNYGILLKLSEIYGNIITIWVGQTPLIVLNGYEAVRECLIINSRHVSERAITPFFKNYAEGKGIIAANGHNWTVQRRLVVKILRNMDLDKKVLGLRIKTEACQLVEILVSQKGIPIDHKYFINLAITNVMSAVCFGHTFSPKDLLLHRIIESSDVMTNFFRTYCGQLYDAFPWFMHRLPGPQQSMYKHLHFLKQYMLYEIRQHQQNPSAEPQDVIDYYLEQISKVHDDPSTTINEENLIQLLVDLILAGYANVAATLQMALLNMAVHQDVQAKVHKEIDAFLENNENLQYEDCTNLPYTNAVIHEIQRFSNVAPLGLPKICTQDIKLQNYSITKGTIIETNLASVHMDPKKWKFPDSFNPSNFLNKEGKFQDNEAFLPFSTGLRICIGEQMARTEIFIFFTILMKTLRFHLPSGVTKSNLNGRGTTSTPHPYKICVIPR
ncbi:cytochrome P450 2J2-like [Engystomops pustulosus]|uniref:cytochrome P450 2J2-like n=1 Tax=Engystomops pustulosus TaxID=76066 RepID=UPI003AFA40E6